jgi:hypothetical protein
MPPLGSGYSLANLISMAATNNNRVWMVDTGQGFSTSDLTTTLFKINTSDPTNPTIISQIDLSAYGGGSKVVKVHRGKVFVGLFPPSATNGNRPGLSDSTGVFVIVDTETDAILGVGSVSTGFDTLRPQDFAFDGSGNVYVNAQRTQSGIMKIYKYVIADVIAAFPSVYSTPVAILPSGSSTTASGSQGLPTSTINVASTVGFPTAGFLDVQNGFAHPSSIQYTGTTPTSFTGCTGGFGTLPNGGTVSYGGPDHIETLTFGAGYLWGSTGLYYHFGGTPPFNGGGRLLRIDPMDGSIVYYTRGTITESIWGCYFAFGHVWASSADSANNYRVYKFDPAAFPSDPSEIIVDPSFTNSNTCEITSDDTTIWVTNGSNFVTGLPSVWRIDPDNEIVIANPTITGLPGSPGSTQGITYDGANIWATLRYANNPGSVGLSGFSNTLGTEAYINTLTNSGFFDPRSVASDNNSNAVPSFFSQPISITSGTDSNNKMFLWVADRGTSFITKVDPFATPEPIVHSQINLAAFGVDPNNGIRQVKYDNGIIYACCHDNNVLILIDATTDNVIGVCNLGQRSRSVAFDGAGNFWASTIDSNLSLFRTTIFKFSIADTLAAFPGSPTPLFQHNLNHHVEHIEFFNGFLWLASGGFQNWGATDKSNGGTSASLNGNVLSGLSGMTSDMNGYFLRLANCGVSTNNSMFQIGAPITSTSVTLFPFANSPTTDTNNGNIVWDIIRNAGEPLMRIDPNDLRTGSAASITTSGPNNFTVTISGLSGMTNADIGKSISINNAVGTCFGGPNNNNVFQIETVINSSTVTVDLGYIGNQGPPGYNSNCAQPNTDANNGSLQWMILTSHNVFDFRDNGFMWSVHAHLGSLWGGNGFHAAIKWDPNNYHPLPPLFPLASTNPQPVFTNSNKKFFQGGFADDGATVWTTADYGGSHAAIRIDPISNTVIAEIPTDDTDNPWTDDIAFDGESMWMTSRNGSVTGIVRFSTTLGSEAQTFRIK